MTFTTDAERLAHSLRLVGPEREPSATLEADRYGPALAIDPQARDALVCLGGSGGRIGLEAQARPAVRGRRRRVLYFDNDHRNLPRTTAPDGTLVSYASGDFVPVGSTSRDDVLTDPRLHEAFLGVGGLLAGASLFELFGRLGEGGFAIRAVSALDYLGSAALIEQRLRRFFRPWLPREREDVQRDVWDEVEPANEELPVAPGPLRVWVAGSGCGSCGAAGVVYLPLLIDRVARELGLDVRIYVILTGPEVYAGLHPWTLENWAATVLDLEALSEGILPAWLRVADPGLVPRLGGPIHRVFSFDASDARGVLADLVADGHEPVVPEALRSAFYQGLGKTLDLLFESEALDRFEQPAGNAAIRPRLWGTAVAGLVDVDPRLLRPAVLAERTAQRLEALAAARA